MDRQLLHYLPEVLREIREYKAILNTEQTEFQSGWQSADYALQESVIVTATEYGLSRWEGMLGIAAKGTDTLEERRFRILAQLSNDIPYTYRQLEKMLTNLCGPGEYEILPDYSNYAITVKVALAAKRNLEAVRELLVQILPANLSFKVLLKYNKHETLRPLTHEQMAAYTQYHLRNEVL